MELLVTVDKNYIPPLQVMLTSLHMNNPGEDVELYLLHSKLQEKELEPLEKQCGRLGYKFFPVKIEDSWFSQALRNSTPEKCITVFSLPVFCLKNFTGSCIWTRTYW